MGVFSKRQLRREYTLRDKTAPDFRKKFDLLTESFVLHILRLF